MAKVTDSGHLARLERLASDEADIAVAQGLELGAENIRESASFSIIEGAISGSGHVASLPGEPPNADTHDLDQSIHALPVDRIGDTITAAVEATSDHALDMEVGNTRVEARPYLSPAAQKNRVNIVRHIAENLRRVMAG